MKIAVDIDDVLAAFTPYAHRYHNVKLDGKVNYWDIEVMDQRLGEGWFSDIIAHNEAFWSDLPMLSHPSDIDFPIACYISSFPQKMFHLRQHWLIMQGFPDAPLIWCDKKHLTCEKLGITHMIDDKPQTILELQRTKTIGIHFMAPYAGFDSVGPHVITSLKQVKEII